MKKVKFIMAFLLLALPMFAQDVKPLNDDGVYEIIEVVNVDGVNVENLYLRAIESLNNWGKSSGKSNSKIEVNDKESGLVIIKGRMWEGAKNAPFGVIWDAYSDFSARIKCKEGRAQITLMVPSMTLIDNMKHNEHTVPLREIIPYKHKSDYTYKKTILKYTPQVYTSMENLMKHIKEKLQNPGDDDF